MLGTHRPQVHQWVSGLWRVRAWVRGQGAGPGLTVPQTVPWGDTGPWPSEAEYRYLLQRADGEGGAGDSSSLPPLPLPFGGKLSLRVGTGSLFWNLPLRCVPGGCPAPKCTNRDITPPGP